MSEESSPINEVPRRAPRRRGSLMGPLLLIILGVLILLNNLGVIQTDLWGLIVRLWPLILIAIGIDSIFKREGLVGPTIMIGLGIVFLLSNFNLLAINVWTLVQYLWPVVLIAIGFDIVFGHRSVIGSLIGLLVVLALLVGAIVYLGLDFSRGQVLQGEEIRQELGDAERARVHLSPAVGSLRVEALEEDGALVAGRAATGRGLRLVQNVSQQGDTAVFDLGASGAAFFLPFGAPALEWSLGIAPDVPLELHAEMGAGEVELDLSGLNVEEVEVDQGVGQVEIIFPAEGEIRAIVDAAIGQTVLVVPEELPVRIEADTAIGNLSVPDGFERDGDAYISPDYDPSRDHLDVDASQAIGQIVVRRR